MQCRKKHHRKRGRAKMGWVDSLSRKMVSVFHDGSCRWVNRVSLRSVPNHHAESQTKATRLLCLQLSCIERNIMSLCSSAVFGESQYLFWRHVALNGMATPGRHAHKLCRQLASLQLRERRNVVSSSRSGSDTMLQPAVTCCRDRHVLACPRRSCVGP